MPLIIEELSSELVIEEPRQAEPARTPALWDQLDRHRELARRDLLDAERTRARGNDD